MWSSHLSASMCPPVETQTRSGGFNWDLLSQTYPEAILEAISSRRPVLTEAYMLPNMSDPENVAEYESWKEWFRNMIHPDDVSRALVLSLASASASARSSPHLAILLVFPRN
jgi:hypothetical protein